VGRGDTEARILSAPTVPDLETGTVMVDGVSTYFRRVGGAGPPTVFVHGNPTHSGDWLPFLERLGRPAIALDLPGWGRSARPSAVEFDYSMTGLARFFNRFLQRMAVELYSLVVHDWGAVALIAAQNEPERVRRLAIANAVPLLPGYRWHRTARVWRTRGLGELSRLLATRRLVDLGLRESRAGFRKHDPAFVAEVHGQLRDRRGAAAILALYRSADPDRLAAAGEDLGSLSCPALVIWGGSDRYLPARFGAAYAERLPAAELVEAPDAGHWPWVDQPELVDRMIRFLRDGEGTRNL
jgi:pimeloyl-ACP methyl ester carboxylesterase